MDKKLLKKKKRAKEIKKLKNMVRNNATDQERLDINKDSYEKLGEDENGEPIVMKKLKEKDAYEVLFRKAVSKTDKGYNGKQVHGN